MRRKILGFLLGLCFAHFVGSAPSLKDFKCPKRNGKFSKPGSACKSYYECVNWKAKEVKCRGKEHFFPEKGYCVRPELYPCFEKPKSKECPLPNGKFLKPKSRCKAYYDCCDGVPKEKRCSPGQLFSQTREICDWSELVTCPEDVKTTKNTPSTPTSTAFPTSTTDSDENSSDESSSSSDEGSSSEEEGIRSSTKSRTTTPKFTTSATHSSDRGNITTEIINTNPNTVTEDNKPSSKNPETSLTTSKFLLSSTTEFPFTSSSFTVSTKEDETKPDINTDSDFETSSSLSPDFSSTSSSFTVSTTEDETKPDINTDSDFETSSSSSPDFSSTSSSFTVSTAEDETKPDINTDSDFEISSSSSPDLLSTSSSFVTFPSTDSGTQTSVTKNNSEPPFTASSATFSSTIEKITKPVDDALSISTSTITTTKHIRTKDYDEKTPVSSTSTSELTTEPVGNKDSDSTTESTFITESVTFDIICPESDGYYPHPYDRHKFVACNGGNVIVMECPSNLVYDHKRRSCQYE